MKKGRKIVTAVLVAALAFAEMTVIPADATGRTEGESRFLAADEAASGSAVSGGAVSGTSATAAPTATPDDEDTRERFDGDSGLTYEVTDSYGDVVGVQITGYREGWLRKDLVIPETIDNYPVLYIESYAFANAPIESVVLPAGLKIIGSEAFARCGRLKSVEIPAGVSTLGSGAFCECSKLKSAVFKGNNLDLIEREVFSYCKKLESIVIPGSVTTIEGCAFYKCTKLNSVTLGKKLKKIESSAFEGDYALKKIRIPASVTKLEEFTFYHCKALETVTFKGNGTKFDKGCFEGCSSLKQIVISGKMKTVPERAFKGCSSLKKAVLSPKTKIIKEKAFSGCEALRNIKLTKSIYGIGNGAFAESGLTSIRLNKNLQYIGNAAFRNTYLKNVKLPKRVTYIGSNVFAGCLRLKKISIPASVRGLSPNALNNCTSLTNIKVAAANRNYSSQSGVLFDKNKTRLLQYPINKKGKAYTVPSSVQVIRSHAFENNKHLTTVSVSAGRIHNHAFYDMAKLKKVTIGNGVRNIASGAFAENESLKTVNMSDSVRVIEYEAFANSSITRIHIPSGIKTLSDSAFEGCYKLAAYDGSASGKYPVADGVLYEKGGRKLRSYPSKKKDRSFTVPGKVTSLSSGAFYRVKHLRKLYFSKSIKNLAYNSIERCNNLREIVFEAGTRLSSGWYAVENCDRLAVIVGPRQSALESMAENAGAALITL